MNGSRCESVRRTNRIASDVTRIEQRLFSVLVDFFRINGPFAKREEMVEQGIDHGRDQHAGHHGWGNGDPGGKNAPEDWGRQR